MKCRKPVFTFCNIPRYWFHGNPVITHNFNGYNLLFPEFERFFVRSVAYFKHQIHDPILSDQITIFSHQEVQHALAHQDYFSVLEQQGYRIQRFLRFYQRYARFIERMATPRLRLALTAAAEHYTASIAGIILNHPKLLENVHPSMKKLIIWHAAEEIEHRSVAFDVMQAVGVNNSTRRLAFIMTSIDMLLWSTLSTLMLLKQDNISLFKSFRFKRQFAKQFPGINKEMRKTLLAYLSKDFHPQKFNHARFAQQQLQAAGFDG